MIAVEDATHPVHLVGDVAQHDGGTNITAIKDPFTTNAVVLIRRMTVSCRSRTVEWRRSSPEANEATLIVNARLGTVRRVGGTLSRPG